MNLFNNMRVIMLSASNTPSHLCAVELKEGTWRSRLFNRNSMYSTGATFRSELVQQHARDHVERLKHAFALVRRGAERGDLEVAVIQQKLHVFHRGDISI